MTNGILKVAIYCRLSEEDRNKQNPFDDSGSIQNQKSMLRDYAYRMGWEIYDIYSDDDYAGADRNRPEFNRLLADAQAKRFDIILCKTQSRFTRELELVEKYINGLFAVWGIRFVSVVDNADTDNKGNKKSRQINGLVNEWYLEDMSDSIKSALDTRRKNGMHIGSFAPYGYKKNPDRKGHLIADEEAASIVREIFFLFSQGYGKTAIARMLNDRGIPNPTEYKRLQGLRFQLPPSKNGTLWKYFAVSDILTNEVYIGNMVQGKYGSISYKTKLNKPRPQTEWIRVENTHEPIIDRTLWDRVQKMIAERAKPFTVGTVGLFAKKARCATCGYVMRSSKSGGRQFLQCPNKHVAKDACIGSFISVKKLESMVLGEMKRLSAEYLDRQALENGITPSCSLTAQQNRIATEIDGYRKKICDYTKAIQDLYLDKSKGIISESDFKDISNGFSQQRERLESIITLRQQELNRLIETEKLGGNSQALIKEYVDTDHLSRAIVEIMIDRIMVGKRFDGTRNVPIEIHWNF